MSTQSEREVRLPVHEAPEEGAMRMLEIGGHRVGVFRVGGELHALADRCPHRGAPLCAGRITTPIDLHDGELVLGSRASVVRCPWHKWEFDIATGRCLVDDKLRVRTYAVHVGVDEIVVSLDR